MKKMKIIAGISQGDINGIGYEIIIKTLMDNRILDFCTPVLYGSPKVAAYHRKALNANNFNFNSVRSIKEINVKKANLINILDDNIRVELGKSTSQAGKASFMSLQKAVNALKEKDIDVLITAPINKDNIQSDKFQFPGHTEYLAKEFRSNDVLMLMVSEIMRVGVVTGHIPLANVPKTLTKEKILSKLRIMNKSLIIDFAIRKPKIAVMGLNPHAGDNGLIGKEEIDIINPAIEEARKEGIMAIGPFAADGFFGSDSFKKFDGILTMYHDQGLIPFKSMEFENGVNYTAGLPIIRTSPAHGTAYEITGRGVASPSSFRAALYLALDIYKNRSLHKEISANPLQKQELPEIKGEDTDETILLKEDETDI